MNNKNIIDGACVGVSTLFTITQTNETLQIISIILTILATLIVIIRNLIDWYVKAKKDGKIDANEGKECVDIIADGVEKISNIIEDNKEEKRKK